MSSMNDTFKFTATANCIAITILQLSNCS